MMKQLLLLSFILFCTLMQVVHAKEYKASIDSLLDQSVVDYDRKQLYDSIQYDLQNALDTALVYQDWQQMARIYIYKAHYAEKYIELKDWEASLLAVRNTLEENRDSFSLGKYNHYWTDNLVRQGIYHYDVGKFDIAIEKFEEGERFIQENNFLSDTTWRLQQSINAYSAKIAALQQEYEKAKSIHLKNIALFQSFSPNSERSVALIYKHLGDIYEAENDTETAIKYYEKAQIILEKNYRTQPNLSTSLLTTYLAKLQFYLKHNRLKEATNVIKRIKRKVPQSTSLDGEKYKWYGAVEKAKNNEKKALNYYEKSLQFFKKKYGENYYKVVEVYQKIGELKASQGKPLEALELYEKAITSFEGNSVFVNEEIAKIENFNPILAKDLSYLKAQTFFELSQQGEESALENAWINIKNSLYLLDKIRSSVDQENELSIVQNNRKIYELALLIASKLGIENIHQLAFDIIEKNKAISLKNILERGKVLNEIGVPDGLIQRERTYKQTLKRLRDKILEESDVKYLPLYFEEKAKYANLLKEFKENHADYFCLNYDTTTIYLDSIQESLLQNTSLVEYFLGDTSLYILVVNEENVHLHQSFLPPDFKDLINDFNLMVATPDIEDDECYSTSAYKLYNLLLEPVKGYLENRLLLVLDGELHTLSFAAFLTSPVNEERAHQYKTHPYLVRKHSISYIPSMAVLNKTSTNLVGIQSLGIAPTFDTLNSILVANNQDTLPSLKYNIQEVQNIELENIDRLSQAKATKDNFLSRLKDTCQIIHIASHAKANDQHISESFIAFADSLLTLKEIFMSSIQANLVVLNACETGKGVLQKAEGIISLAYSFFYAGAQSLVSTQWVIEDQSSKDIMIEFHDNLKFGNSKDYALTKAQRSYWKQPTDHKDAHPYYWAAYQVSGNLDPLFGTRPNPNTWYLVLFILLSFVLGFWLRYRMSKNY